MCSPLAQKLEINIEIPSSLVLAFHFPLNGEQGSLLPALTPGKHFCEFWLSQKITFSYTNTRTEPKTFVILKPSGRAFLAQGEQISTRDSPVWKRTPSHGIS